MKKKTGGRLLALLLAVMLLLLQVTVAFGDNGIADVDELTGSGPDDINGLSNGGRYMSNKYRDNYYLDIEELGIMDVMPAAGSFLANTLFSLDRLIVQASAFVFYHCSTFQLAELLEDRMDNVQKSMKEQIFDVLLPFAIIALGVFLIQALVKQNGQAMVGQAVSFFSVMLLATILTTQTAAFVAVVDDLTRGVSQAIVHAVYNIGGGDDVGDTTSYAADVVGSMWDILVHKPWVTLNLEGEERLTEKLLVENPQSEERIKIIQEELKNTTNTLFTKNKPGEQVGLLLLYTVPLLLKCGVYICIGGLQLAFRVLTVLLALFGIIVLFLALVPQLGGTRLIGSWVRKLLEIQINIIVLSLVLSVIMLLDKLLYKYVEPWGWIIVIILQTILCVVIFLMRNQIFTLSKTVGQVVSQPAALQKMERQVRGVTKHFDDGVYAAAKRGGNYAEQRLQRKMTSFKDATERRVVGSVAWAKPPAPARRSYYGNAGAVGGGVDTTPPAAPVTGEAMPRPRLYMQDRPTTQTLEMETDSTPPQPIRLASISHPANAGPPLAETPPSTPAPTTRPPIQVVQATTAQQTQRYRVYGYSGVTVPGLRPLQAVGPTGDPQPMKPIATRPGRLEPQFPPSPRTGAPDTPRAVKLASRPPGRGEPPQRPPFVDTAAALRPVKLSPLRPGAMEQEPPPSSAAATSPTEQQPQYPADSADNPPAPTQTVTFPAPTPAAVARQPKRQAAKEPQPQRRTAAPLQPPKEPPAPVTLPHTGRAAPVGPTEQNDKERPRPTTAKTGPVASSQKETTTGKQKPTRRATGGKDSTPAPALPPRSYSRAQSTSSAKPLHPVTVKKRGKA